MYLKLQAAGTLLVEHIKENKTLKEALKKEFKEETNFGGRWVNGCPKRRASDRIKVIIVFQRLQLKEKSSLTVESEEFICSPKSQPTPSTTTPNTCQSANTRKSTKQKEFEEISCGDLQDPLYNSRSKNISVLEYQTSKFLLSIPKLKRK